MANLLGRGASMLARRVSDSMSDTVTYARSGYASIELSAAMGGTDYDDDSGEIAVVAKTVDFIFKASDLVINGELTEPLRGDEITATAAGSGRRVRYRVLPMSGEHVFRYVDGSEHLVRVHTKRVGSVAA